MSVATAGAVVRLRACYIDSAVFSGITEGPFSSLVSLTGDSHRKARLGPVTKLRLSANSESESETRLGSNSVSCAKCLHVAPKEPKRPTGPFAVAGLFGLRISSDQQQLVMLY